MNAEKVKKDIERAIDMAETIHNDMVGYFDVDSIDSDIKEQAMEIVSELATLVRHLEHVSEGVRA